MAFGFSLLDIPGTILQLTGVLPLTVPLWYGLLRMGVSAVQGGIAFWMLRLCRHHGVWTTGGAHGPAA